MKCVVGEYELTREEYEKFINSRDKIIKLWEAIKQTVTELIGRVLNTFKDIVSYLRDNPPVGYKRFFKQDELNYYKRISKGKSNNWRKLKGLPLIRKKTLT